MFRRSFGFTPVRCWLAQVSRHTTATTVEKTVRELLMYQITSPG